MASHATPSLFRDAEISDQDSIFGPPAKSYVTGAALKRLKTIRVGNFEIGTKVSFTERDYQTEAVNDIHREFQTHRSTLAVMATGLGKTIVAGRMAEKTLDGDYGDGSFLFLAHREELITQAYASMKSLLPKIRIGIEKAEQHASPHDRIVIASKDTLYQPRRLALYDARRFSMICIDEAHHVAKSNKSYMNILNHFPHAKRLGVTATPDRTDEKALGQIFDSVAVNKDILFGIENGWLVKVGQRLVTCAGLDYSEIGLNREGDFHEADLADVLKREAPLYAVVEAAIRYSNLPTRSNPNGQRPTLIFAASTSHARILADVLNRRHEKYGTGRAASIDCKTVKSDMRREIIRLYKAGEIRYLVNYGILTEGFDDTNTRVIVIARPTKSRGLYQQMAGRAVRVHHTIAREIGLLKTAAERLALIAQSPKPGCLLVDLVGLNHKLTITATDILGGRYDDDAVKMAKAKIAAQQAESDEESSVADVNIELRRAQKLVEEERARQKAKNVIVKAKIAVKHVDPFNVLDVTADREPGWSKGKPATAAQKERLLKFGLPKKEVEELTCHKASRLMEICINRYEQGLCSYKTAAQLRRFGYDPNMSREAASRIIVELKNAGWKRVAK